MPKSAKFTSFPSLLTALVLIVASWYYMVFAMTMNMDPVSSWTSMDLFLLFVMWTIMMAGMMLPSTLPTLLLVERMNQQRQLRGASYTRTGYFILGYLMVWTLFSALITLIQWGLHYQALLSPMMKSANPYFSALLLFLAGLYQWSPLKKTCLSYCRSPLSLLSSNWQDGIGGAITFGFKHGQYCLGCCWILMALLFVTGVMDLQWILILSVIVLIEKVLPYDIISQLLGAVLVGYALLLVV